MKTLNSIELINLLPSSISEDLEVQKAASSIDPELKKVSGSLYLGAIFANVNKLNSRQLDHLAYCFDLNTWRDSWPIDRKRAVATTVVAQKCRMGTLSAVKKVLASLGSAVAITEWWQKNPKGEPHTFEVTASVGQIEGGLAEEAQEDFFRLLDEAKPVRSHYTFTLVQSCLGKITFSTQFRSATFIRCCNESLPVKGEIVFRSLIRSASFVRI